MKAIIYNRVSTKDQEPENQVKDCKLLTEELNIKNPIVLQEKESAYKNEEKRLLFKQIIEGITKQEINTLIVWDLDRIWRNRKKLEEFFNLCKIKNCKIYSFRQGFLNEIQNIKLPEGFSFIKDMMFNNFLQFLGWIAEEESKKKSERVKSAVRKEKGITKSYKGNKWGRKSYTNRVKKQVLELHKKGLNYRKIREQVFVYDKNNNKKNISIGGICNIINEVRKNEN